MSTYRAALRHAIRRVEVEAPRRTYSASAFVRELGGPPIQHVDIPESVAADHMQKAGASEELAAAMVETLDTIRNGRFA